MTTLTEAIPVAPKQANRVRSRRNPVLLAGAAALIVTGAAGVAWMVTAVADTTAVLVTARVIPAGSVITAADLGTAQMSVDPSVSTVPATQRDSLIGARVATALPAGQLLTPDSVTSDPIPGPGESVVGIAVTPAQLPGTPLSAGDPVTLIAGAKPGDDITAADSPSMPATVVSTATGADTSTVVDVAVPVAYANQLATWASTGRVVIVLDAPGSR